MVEAFLLTPLGQRCIQSLNVLSRHVVVLLLLLDHLLMRSRQVLK